jgi:cysteine-rich repeat protein
MVKVVCAAIITLCMIDSSMAAWGKKRAPAGQMCPRGSHVIGFDSEANIICTEACGNGVLNPGETCDDGNTESGDGCPSTCQSGEAAIDSAKPVGANEAVATQAIPADSGTTPFPSNPIISDVEPSKLQWGTRELEITVSGTGFNEDSLNIGPYMITVSNGPGMETTQKRALEIY